MTKPREFLLYFENDCFVLHGGASCLSLGSPGNHLLTSCHQICIEQGHLEAHLGWELLPFTIPAGLLWAEVRLLCVQWIHDHHSDRGYLSILQQLHLRVAKILKEKLVIIQYQPPTLHN